MTTTNDSDASFSSSTNGQIVGLFVIMVFVTIMPKELAYLVCVVVGAATYLLFLMLQPNMAHVFKNKSDAKPKLFESSTLRAPCVENETTLTDVAPDDEVEVVEAPPTTQKKKTDQALFDNFKKQVFEHFAEVEATMEEDTIPDADVRPVTDMDAKESKLSADAVPFVFSGTIVSDVASCAGPANCPSTTRLSAAAPPFILTGKQMDAMGPFRPVSVPTSLNPAAKPFLGGQCQSSTVSSGVYPRGPQCSWADPVPPITKGPIKPPGIWSRPVGTGVPIGAGAPISAGANIGCVLKPGQLGRQYYNVGSMEPAFAQG